MNTTPTLRLAALLLILALSLAAVQRSTSSQRAEHNPIRIRLYSSLRLGISDRRARGATQPLVNLLAEKIDYPIDFDLANGTRLQGLREFGGKFDTGEIHLGVVWGIEYGWLAEKFSDIEPMVIASNGTNMAHSSQLMVRRRNLPLRLSKLEGKRLAQPVHAPLMDRLFLNHTLKNGGFNPKEFFQVIEFPTVKEAIRAVRDGGADCVVVDNITLARLTAVQPKIVSKLVMIAHAQKPFPAPAVVGRKEALEKLQPGLWDRMQKELLDIHSTAEGEQLTRFWRFPAFVMPHSRFLSELENAKSAYPIAILLDTTLNERE